MNNKIRINSLLLLVIYMLSTKISATNQIDLLEEEIKPLKIKIELCEKIYEEIKNKQNSLINTHTGLTPDKNKIAMHCYDSPVKQKMVPQITKIKKKCARNLFNENKSNTKEIYKTIFHNNYEFQSNKWAFFDPYQKNYNYSSVLIDCDDKIFDNIAKEITKKIKSKNPNIFLKIIINYINDNIEILKNLLTYEKSPDGFCCRHFSTLALPIFAKVLEDDSHNFKGKIHQLSSNVINEEWKSPEGHAWNVLMLEEQDKGNIVYSYWFVDVYNKCFLKIPVILQKKLKIYYIENKNLKTKTIITNNHYYQYAKTTFDKYISKDNDLKQKMELGAYKLMAKNNLF